MGAPIRRRAAGLAAAAAVLVVAGCSSSPSTGAPGAGAASGGPTSGTRPSGSAAPSDGGGPGLLAQPSDATGSATAGFGSSSGSGSGSGGSGGQPPSSSPLQGEPGPMLAPMVVGAEALGCERLTGGGVRARFRVQFDGGQNWAVIARKGPVARTNGGTWTVTVLDQTGPSSIRLANLLVGGGSPYRTATVVVPQPPTVTCPR